jgi:hypothetical protein
MLALRLVVSALNVAISVTVVRKWIYAAFAKDERHRLRPGEASVPR